MNTTNKERQGSWRSPRRLGLLVFLGAAAFFLLTEHKAHVLGALPFIILLLCAGMHFFMHTGHDSHGPNKGGDDGQ